jgi:YbbR domain-containing protein
MNRKSINIIVATTLFAVLLWASVNMTNEFQSSISIPLIVRNIPEAKALAAFLPQSVDLRLRGNGWRLVALHIGADLQCVIDLRSVSSRTLSLKDVVDRIGLPQELHAVDMDPETLTIRIESKTHKSVPVFLDGSIGYREGFGQVQPTVITPESVRVEGAASIVRSIRSWATERFVVDNLRAPLKTEIALIDTGTHLLTFTPSRVTISIPVQQFAEKTLPGLVVETRSVPQKKEVILRPPKVDIVVRGGIEQLAGLTAGDVSLYVEYRDIVDDTTGQVEVRITHPPGFHVVTKRPERLQYIVRTRL